jgi:LacI family transcriptional regulator
MARRTTLKDVAREAGLSETAVSLVLNNRPCRLSEESKTRIRETAHRLNYRVNQVARGLAVSRSYTMGLIVPDIENPFFSSLAKKLEEACRASGYGLLVANSDDDVSRDCEQLERFDARGVDGIVYVASDGRAKDGADTTRLLHTLEGLSTPFVMADRVIEGIECDKVTVNNKRGAYDAITYLIGHGHTRIGCLVNARHSQSGYWRLAGYTQALADCGIESNPNLVVDCSYKAASGYEGCARLLESGVTAIFSTSDLISAGVMRCLGERALTVPEDISLVSFDNNSSLALSWPDIASVNQDVAGIASAAFKMLERRVSGYSGPAESVVLPAVLLEGSSVKRIG